MDKLLEGFRLTLDVPEDVLLRRRGVEDVESNCVQAVLLHYLLRVQTVMLRLAHLLPRQLNTTPAPHHRLLTWKERVTSFLSEASGL